MAFQVPITIGKALERIFHHDYVLPAIQREFVWQTDQIARLFDSLMQGYPIGSFLFWTVEKAHAKDYVFYEFMTDYHQRLNRRLRRLELGEPRPLTAILDGQQRLTALNIGLRGSHAEKLPHKRASNADAYPIRQLFLRLDARAQDNELGMVYDFRFLADSQAKERTERGEEWFPVRSILNIGGVPEVFSYVQQRGLANSPFAFPTLSSLLEVVKSRPIINFYEEESQDLDKVLNIFIRVNSGGTTLSYSDLLLSIASAQWRDVEAREVIYGLVDELNETGLGFNLSKDLVLKAGLMLIDSPSIAFRVTNFNAANMARLEASWDAIAAALRLAVQAMSDFGFSERTLTADSVVIPVAYYLHRRGLAANYLTHHHYREDREALRTWVVRSLLKPGIWGSGLDTLLLALRAVIQQHGTPGFPAVDMEREMGRLGKSLQIDQEEIQDMLGLVWKHPRTFALLSLLYPGMDLKNEFHVDHVVPRSLFTRSRLRASGLSDVDIEDAMRRVDTIANLQLLEGPLNVSKQDSMPRDWIARQFCDELEANHYLYRHDLGDLPDSLTAFNSWHGERENRMAWKLRSLLGASDVPTEVA